MRHRPGNQKIRFIFFVAIAILLQHSCGPGKKDAAEEKQMPNIILIVADDLGYGDLGCYGQDSISTPHIDNLAKEGMRFTAHYAGSTVCAPSRCALLTGLHTGHTAVRGNRPADPMGQYPLPETAVTVASVLSEGGYTTAAIGKWGLGGPGSTGEPGRQGFDYFFGYLCQGHAHNYYPDFLFKNKERINIDNVMPEPPHPKGMGVAVEKNTYSHDLFVEEALQYIRNAAPGQPFFLYLPFTIPHANNEAGDAGMEVPDYGAYTDKKWPEPQKGLAAMISMLDAGVGAVVKALDHANLDSNTILFFTSDNGPHREGGNDPAFFKSNGGFRGIKRDLYEGGIRVPLIVRWPGLIPAGTTSDHISAHWDFLTTVCDIAGLEPAELTDGISYLPALTGGMQPKHDYLYWEFHSQGGVQAVRMGPWKGIVLQAMNPENAIFELYNLEQDPGERHDIAADHPKIVEVMRKIMVSAHYETPEWPFLQHDALGGLQAYR
jgi:arylsulfatase A-like enzyme